MEEPLQASPTMNREVEMLVNQVRGFTHKSTSTITQLQGDVFKANNMLEKSLHDAAKLEGKLALAQRQNKTLSKEL